MRRYFLFILIFFSLPQAGFCQAFQVQAKSENQAIEFFTQMMDEGAHGVLLKINMSESNQLMVDSTLLSDVIKALEWHTKSYTRYEIKYIIELGKSSAYAQVSKAVYDLLDQYIPLRRVTIQSRDFRILKYWKRHYPEIKLSVLINNQNSIDTNLANLGFKPTVYSPNYHSLTRKKVSNLHKRSIKVIPWTVNDTTTMQELIGWKVDGFITNAPNQSLILGVNQAVKDGH